MIKKQKHTFTCNNGGTNGIFICRLHNESFDIYELQLLGLDKKDSYSYTSSGTATISDTELQKLLHTKGLSFPMRCFI